MHEEEDLLLRGLYRRVGGFVEEAGQLDGEDSFFAASASSQHHHSAPYRQSAASSLLYDDPGGYDDGGSFWLHRLLAGAAPGDGGPTRIDYSVLSVGVMTLGLIMVVEVLRHRLDVAALGRPFFKAVLEGVYAERELFS